MSVLFSDLMSLLVPDLVSWSDSEETVVGCPLSASTPGNWRRRRSATFTPVAIRTVIPSRSRLRWITPLVKVGLL